MIAMHDDKGKVLAIALGTMEFLRRACTEGAVAAGEQFKLAGQIDRQLARTIPALSELFSIWGGH
jgi:hypothetical protein